MFEFLGRKQQAVAVMEPKAAVPPTPKLIEYAVAQADHVALSKELGLIGGEVRALELEIFLREEGIGVYSTQAVRDYLVAKNDGKKFKLFPARTRDLEWSSKNSLWADVMKIGTPSFWETCKSKDRTYRGIVPVPVLLTIKKLVTKFGDEVHFYIAAISDDPFLAVALGDSQLQFIERWDEPAFRG